MGKGRIHQAAAIRENQKKREIANLQSLSLSLSLE